jgi:peptide/nickel transport system substrate-binding protein
VKKILHGHGLVGNDHPIGPANQYWANGLPQRTYDPDKAKFHLKKADLSSLSLQLSAADAAFPGAVDAAALYRENAAAAGINIDITREPNDGYWSNIWMKKPWCACYWSGRATEGWMFSTAYEAGVPWNDTFWNHEKFNALLIEARAELDTDRRRDMYRDLQTIVRDEGGVVIPMFANYVDAASSKLAHGPSLGNNWQLDGVRLAERWWFA